MLIVNPPWQFDKTIQPLLRWLWQALSPGGEGGVRVDWLAPEAARPARPLRNERPRSRS
jgi:23S rRNA A2030 N6-methylase RlmJ